MKLHIYLGGGGLFKQPKCNNVRKGQAGVKRKVGFKKMFAERSELEKTGVCFSKLEFHIVCIYCVLFFISSNWRE